MIPQADLPPGARPDFLLPDNSYQLLYPVTYQVGEERHLLERLQLRRMTGAEKIMAEGPESHTERTINIIASMTSQMKIVLAKIDWVDLDRLDECLGFFTMHGPATGATS